MPLTLTPNTDTSALTRFAGRLDAVMAAPAEQPGPMRDAVQEQARTYAADTQRRFNNASGGDGTWVPLKPRTIRQKRRYTLFPDRILYLTGELYLSLIPGQGNNVFETRPDRVVYGTRDPKAVYHQYGVPSRHLPRRPILVTPDANILRQLAAIANGGWQETITNAQRP